MGHFEYAVLGMLGFLCLCVIILIFRRPAKRATEAVVPIGPSEIMVTAAPEPTESVDDDPRSDLIANLTEIAEELRKLQRLRIHRISDRSTTAEVKTAYEQAGEAYMDTGFTIAHGLAFSAPQLYAPAIQLTDALVHLENTYLGLAEICVDEPWWKTFAGGAAKGASKGLIAGFWDLFTETEEVPVKEAIILSDLGRYSCDYQLALSHIRGLLIVLEMQHLLPE